MHPSGSKDDSHSEGQSESEGFDTWRVLEKVTAQQRADLLADIVGHPEGAPSVAELDYMNPELKPDAIRRHLHILQDVGAVSQLVIPPGERVRNRPYKFYTLTEKARELFDRNNLFPKEAWQRQYTSVEKPDDIKQLENLPRPSQK